LTTLTYTPERETLRMVWVKWIDAVVETNEHWIWRNSWRPRDAGGLECHSIGYLIHDDEQSVVLAQSINDGAMDNLITLPRGMVLEMKELKLSRSR
jgi:aryl-phospho-beta-D-glucosidase BglC (GH1 family)